MDIEYANSKITHLINEYVHSERDRAILLDRYTKWHSYKMLAANHGLTMRRIQKIDYDFRMGVLLKHKDELI